MMQARKHITGDLLKAAAAVNIEVLAIDPSKPVAEQGNFDLILQKCRDSGEPQCVVDLPIPAVYIACAVTRGLCIALSLFLTTSASMHAERCMLNAPRTRSARCRQAEVWHKQYLLHLQDGASVCFITCSTTHVQG